MDLETLTDWIVFLGSALQVAVILGSWLASIHTTRLAAAGLSAWFNLPAWAQVAAGFGVVGLAVYAGYLLWIPLPFYPSLTVVATQSAIGLTAFLAGLCLALWARWALGGMYGVSTSSAAPLQSTHRLIRHGPYAWVRHPMYLGYWLVIAGVLLIYRTWTPLLLLMVCVPAFYRRARREDETLAQTFGADWQSYAARTTSLIPFVY